MQSYVVGWTGIISLFRIKSQQHNHLFNPDEFWADQNWLVLIDTLMF